jgi:endogenous inhibitor of DNA gyrase (YacG/DUF329 family)
MTLIQNNSKITYLGRKCPICEKELILKKYGRKYNWDQIYCSRKCRDKARIKIYIKKCIICGKVFKLRPKYRFYKTCSKKCFALAHSNKNHYNYKGGHLNKQSGYRVISVNNVQILEHRYIMEQHIGRKLKRSEIVHHINGIRSDNRISNLTITNLHEHETHTFVPLLQKRIRFLEKKVKRLLERGHK